MTQQQHSDDTTSTFSIFGAAPLNTIPGLGQNHDDVTPQLAEPSEYLGHALTPVQAELLTAVITSGQPLTPDDPNPSTTERQEILAQLTADRTDDSCDCGICPSFPIIYPGVTTPGSGPSTILTAGTRDGQIIVLLTVQGGRVTDCEIAPVGDALVTLPAASDLTF